MKKTKIAIIGLGYVGLPLAAEFGKKIETVGYDINRVRIEELLVGKDNTLELSEEELRKSKMLKYTSNPEDIRDCNYFIVTVPTPKPQRFEIQIIIFNTESYLYKIL